MISIFQCKRTTAVFVTSHSHTIILNDSRTGNAHFSSHIINCRCNLPMMDDGRSLCVSDGGKIGSSDVLCSGTSIEFIAFNSKLECRVWLLLLLVWFCGSSISLIFADENSLIDFNLFLPAWKCFHLICVSL